MIWWIPHDIHCTTGLAGTLPCPKVIIQNHTLALCLHARFLHWCTQNGLMNYSMLAANMPTLTGNLWYVPPVLNAPDYVAPCMWHQSHHCRESESIRKWSARTCADQVKTKETKEQDIHWQLVIAKFQASMPPAQPFRSMTKISRRNM